MEDYEQTSIGHIRVLAALSLGTPAVMADHGHGDSKNEHGNKHSASDDDRGWEHRDGYEYRTYGDRDGRAPGWSRGRKPAGEIAVYLPAKARSTAVGATPIRAFLTTTRTSKGRSLFDAH